jgi:hypothetical protein
MLERTAFGGFKDGKANFTGIAGGVDPFGFHEEFKIADTGNSFRKHFNFVLSTGFDVHIHGTFHTAARDTEIFEEYFPVDNSIYPGLGKGLIPEVLPIINHKKSFPDRYNFVNQAQQQFRIQNNHGQTRINE